jgi:hypothetical protein
MVADSRLSRSRSALSNTGRSTQRRLSRRQVAHHLSVERRVPIDEDHREAERVREEIARRLDVGDEQLRLGAGERRPRALSVPLNRHGFAPACCSAYETVHVRHTSRRPWSGVAS